MSHVIARVQGRVGHITLNRPERINALSLQMIRAVVEALDEFAFHPDVDMLLIDGAGERGLCAGGDIRDVYEGMHGTGIAPGRFWGAEYRMNAQIAHYPKPVVAFMDGIVFGGGVGISAHASVRIVTERSRVAMPETAIGLCPDVGSLYLLARAPGSFGVHAALTGARLDAAEAIHAGLADHLVRSSDLAEVTEMLKSGVVPAFSRVDPAAHPEWVDTCYAESNVEDILAALRARPEMDATAAAAVIEQMSPTALKVTLEAVHRAAWMTVDEVLDQDLRVCSRFLAHPDLAEGIRAQVIDKDRAPRWHPAELADVTVEQVQAYFAPLPEGRSS